MALTSFPKTKTRLATTHSIPENPRGKMTPFFERKMHSDKNWGGREGLGAQLNPRRDGGGRKKGSEEVLAAIIMQNI